ncbi:MULTISPECIES: DUF5819 family protein [unclassified Streptomyces]|uniref:DUF5819 family protein n=1 Tax=unclassified Streptomyces TaxID=2593676 RepID=UPI0009C338AC|nr:DUF5819 family protein [Streptomyces sp. Sge12]ARE73271.1 hypothetical protein B6R96_04410 [Streptomyces sp. Sge12]
MRKTGWAVSSGIESAGVKELHRSDSPPAREECPAEVAGPGKSPMGVRFLRSGLYAAVVLCLVTALVHVVLVFFHVAPANPVSKRYSSQINGWVYPLFEQNWRLFAPDPDSFNRKILARTAHTDSKGSMQVTSWFDLAAVDHSEVDHNVFPSHTSQNLLRRAWTSYVETHGASDTPRSERAVMLQTYLRNIAVDRVTDHDDGRAVEFIQLRVVTLPVAAPGTTAGNRPPAPTEDRLLPWWKVTSHGK